MSDPAVIGDREKYADAGRRYNHLKPANALAEEWVRATGDAEGAREMLAEEEDPEVREMLRAAEQRLAELEEEIRLAMVEPDPTTTSP